MFHTILAATDGTDLSVRATEIAADLAAMYGARLILLRVLPNADMDEGLRELARTEHMTGPTRINRDIVTAATWYGPLYQAPATTETVDTGALRQRIEERLELQAHSLTAKRKIPAVTPILTSGDPSKDILDVAREQSVDAIVMGSGEHSKLGSLFGRSVSQKVSANADCTCLIVR